VIWFDEIPCTLPYLSSTFLLYPVPPLSSVLQLKLGEIKAGSSYIPTGLSAKQYAELRAKEAKKKRDNYERNVKKAGVFVDFTDWYKQRGTDLKQTWKKDRNLGHTMTKVRSHFTRRVEVNVSRNMYLTCYLLILFTD
jgi:hypothetical protein